MPLRGSLFDILGVSVGRVGAVQDLVHVEFDEGVTAFYGANGVGKTQILKLIAHALRGSNPASVTEVGRPVLDVHLQFHRDLLFSGRGQFGMTPLDYLVTVLFEKLRAVTAELRERDIFVDPDDARPVLVRLDEAQSSLLRAQRSERGESTGPTADGHLGLAVWEPLARAAAEARRITLRAVGTRDEPQWQMMLACDPVSVAEADRAAQETWAALENDETPRPIDLGSPCDGVYWSETYPERGPRVPQTLQIPLSARPSLGIVQATREVVEVRSGLPQKTSYSVREPIAGFHIAAIRGDIHGDLEVDRATLNHLLDTRESFLEGFMHEDENGEFDDELLEDVRALETAANEIAQHVLVHKPELTFDLLDPESWIRGILPRWRADGWDLSHLSHAERRWVSLAADLARGGGPIVLLCDEPEQGLHRLAEHRLATHLPKLMRERGGIALVATHSPDLLNAPGVTSFFVTRDDKGGVRSRAARPSFIDGHTARETAREFSLAPGDLLSLSRLSVVVEGIHDEWVFKNLLRDELDGASAGILPMHGATRLRALPEARLLIDGTDAKILVVLDELDHDVAQDAFEALRNASKNHDAEKQQQALSRMLELGKTNDSFQFIHQMALEAVNLGVLERIELFGMSLPDIICYLDPRSILQSEKEHTWDELIEQWTADFAPKPAKNLKGWLRKKRLLPDDPRVIDEAIEFAAVRARDEGAPVHPDLVALGTTINLLGQTAGQ